MSVVLFGVASITLKLALNGARVLQSPQASGEVSVIDDENVVEEEEQNRLVPTSLITPSRDVAEVTINISRTSSSSNLLSNNGMESSSFSTPHITISTPLASLQVPLSSPFSEYSQRVHAILTQIAIDEGYFSPADAWRRIAPLMDYSSLLLTDSPVILNTSTADMTPSVTDIATPDVAVREIRGDYSLQESENADNMEDSYEAMQSVLLDASFAVDIDAPTGGMSAMEESLDGGFDVLLSPMRFTEDLDAVNLSATFEASQDITPLPLSPPIADDNPNSTSPAPVAASAVPQPPAPIVADLVVADVLTPEQREAEIIGRAVEYLQKIEEAKCAKQRRIEQLQAQRSTASEGNNKYYNSRYWEQ